MGARVRGHYRIDHMSRVMPLTDVNGAMVAYSVPLPRRRGQASEQRSRIIKMALGGVALFSFTVAVMMTLPTIEKSLVAANATRIASAREAIYKNHPELRPRHRHDRTAEN